MGRERTSSRDLSIVAMLEDVLRRSGWGGFGVGGGEGREFDTFCRTLNHSTPTTPPLHYGIQRRRSRSGRVWGRIEYAPYGPIIRRSTDLIP